MITPQLTEQYGHVLRVSVVLEILSPCACAYTGARLNPNTETPAPPIKVVLMKVRLETSMTGTPSNSNFELRPNNRGCSNRGETKKSTNCRARALVLKTMLHQEYPSSRLHVLWPRISAKRM